MAGWIGLVVAFDKNSVFTYPGGKRDSGVEDPPSWRPT